jgi:hypothetical protein
MEWILLFSSECNQLSANCGVCQSAIAARARSEYVVSSGFTP